MECDKLQVSLAWASVTNKLIPLVQLVTFLSILLFTPQSDALAASADPGFRRGVVAGWQKHSIEVEGVRRWFRIFAPSPKTTGRPVLLLLHGGFRSMNELFSKRAGAAREWPILAKREQFLLVVPNGVNPITGDPRGDLQQWDTSRDVSFLLQLLRWTHANLQTDAKRVYIAGASNGGMMAYKMLIDHPEAFAAGAAFLANMPIESTRKSRPRRPVPIMIVNGTDDPLVRYGGSRPWLGSKTYVSAMETARWWAGVNGYQLDQATEAVLPDLDPTDGCRMRVTRFEAASDFGAPVHLYTMIGGGHAMPSRKHASRDRWLVKWVIGPRCRDAEAAELAWGFFRQFSR